MPGLNFVKQNQPAMQPGDDAIPEAKVAFRGLLRRKLLAMTSEVAKLLAMTRGAKDVKLQSDLIP